MVRINLKSFDISALRINFEASLPEDLLEIMGSVCPPDEDGDFVFVDSYKVEGVGHAASAIVSELKKGAKEFGFEFMYRVRRGGRLGKDVPRTSQLLEILSAIKEPVWFNCLLRFIFGKRSKTNTLINLPIKVTAQPNAPFNEIHGIHFVKLEKKELEYEVILDLLDEGGLMETVIFRHRNRISESTIEKIVRKAVEISNSFVSKEE